MAGFGAEPREEARRMRKYCCVILAAVCLLALAGCTSAGAAGREPEDTVLVQVVGVDVDGRGVVVTAAGRDGEETAVVSASGSSLEEAFAALPTAGDRYLSLTNVTQVLVGDGVDAAAVLRYVLEDPDMSYMARAWAAGYAGGLMEELKEQGLERFQLLEEGGAETVTVKTALAELLEGKEAVLPSLAMGQAGLEVAGKLYFEVR